MIGFYLWNVYFVSANHRSYCFTEKKEKKEALRSDRTKDSKGLSKKDQLGVTILFSYHPLIKKLCLHNNHISGVTKAKVTSYVKLFDISCVIHRNILTETTPSFFFCLYFLLELIQRIQWLKCDKKK